MYMPSRGPSGASSPRSAYMAGKGSIGSPQASYIGKATSGGLPSKEADYKPDEKETKKAAKEEKVEVETEVDAEKEVKAAGKHVIETEDDEEIYFCKQHKREEYEGTHDAAKTDKKKKS